MTAVDTFGRTIQLFLADRSPSGRIIASIHDWTGSVLVSTQSTFGRLLARPEVNRTGIYILHGPDPEDALRMVPISARPIASVSGLATVRTSAAFGKRRSSSRPRMRL
jgi:hypothetical protein